MSNERDNLIQSVSLLENQISTIHSTISEQERKFGSSFWVADGVHAICVTSDARNVRSFNNILADMEFDPIKRVISVSAATMRLLKEQLHYSFLRGYEKRGFFDTIRPCGRCVIRCQIVSIKRNDFNDSDRVIDFPFIKENISPDDSCHLSKDNVSRDLLQEICVWNAGSDQLEKIKMICAMAMPTWTPARTRDKLLNTDVYVDPITMTAIPWERGRLAVFLGYPIHEFHPLLEAMGGMLDLLPVPTQLPERDYCADFGRLTKVVCRVGGDMRWSILGYINKFQNIDENTGPFTMKTVLDTVYGDDDCSLFVHSDNHVFCMARDTMSEERKQWENLIRLLLLKLQKDWSYYYQLVDDLVRNYDELELMTSQVNQKKQQLHELIKPSASATVAEPSASAAETFTAAEPSSSSQSSRVEVPAKKKCRSEEIK